MQIKQTLKDNVDTTKVVVKNLSELADAVCLAVVSGYAIYESLQKNHRTFFYNLLLVASSLIAVQAFILFVRHLNKPSAK